MGKSGENRALPMHCDKRMVRDCTEPEEHHLMTGVQGLSPALDHVVYRGETAPGVDISVLTGKTGQIESHHSCSLETLIYRAFIIFMVGNLGEIPGSLLAIYGVIWFVSEHHVEV